ncbi:MAG TPA: hypothetical protein VLI54_01495 [Bacillota bacterium]|nr:hypothetical protein [Bacillota bacterium]
MDQQLPIESLAKSIKQVFIDADKYPMDKHVPSFRVDGTFLGDCFNYTIVEPVEGKPPIFYHTYSPYDVVSHKAPDQALIFQDGALLLNADFAGYVSQRTGVMSALVLQALGVTTLADKKFLMVGTGAIAQCALRALKALYPDLAACAFMNSGSEASDFIALADKLGISCTRGTIGAIQEYDYIICHSAATQPVLTAEMCTRIKPGAVIASFVSEDKVELAPEFYDAEHANVLIDWDQTIKDSPELNEAVTRTIANPERIIRLRELFNGSAILKPDAQYTVYRSHGTPMQNLAVLKLLLAAR